MKKIIISILAILGHFMMYGQSNLNTVLDTIEENNTTLKSLRARYDAQILQNSTFNNLSNPEVGFNYLWGSPGEIGSRTDFSISQTFDFSTITGRKGQMVDELNNLIEWKFKAERMNVLSEAKLYFIELIYYNELQQEMKLRLDHAQSIHKAFVERMESGDANILEFNKVKLNLSMVEGELSRIKLERTSLLEQLMRLNGGKEMIITEYENNPINLPVSFDDWFVTAEQKNPVLAYVKQAVEVKRTQVSLNKAQNLPQISVGYMSEKVVDQHFQGITTGITIPLWQNKNQVKQAEAKVLAAEENVFDSKQQFYSQLQIQYNRTIALMANAEQYRNTLETSNNTDLLKKALDLGQISILDYILEISLYYETVNRALEAERDCQKAYAKLTAVEL